MTPNERFRAFKQRTGLTVLQLSRMFGVSEMACAGWLYNKNGMSRDCQMTLERFERDGIDCLEKVRPQRMAG
jgi:hypothetical protein